MINLYFYLGSLYSCISCYLRVRTWAPHLDQGKCFEPYVLAILN